MFAIRRTLTLCVCASLGYLFITGVCSVFKQFKAVQARPLHELSTAELLEDALVLHNNTRGDAWIIATDPNERYESLFSAHMLKDMVKRGDLNALFDAVDEGFELEVDRRQGMGSPPLPPAGLPFMPRPLHKGERGGLDGTSCRSCHFNGGPDGGGTGTSMAFFRGDGERISKSVMRDAPALMGAGYIAILAIQMSEKLKQIRAKAISTAQYTQREIRLPLKTHGVTFGWIRADAKGEVFTDEVSGVSDDLIVRPFGWKGRHHSLVEVADESLQQHHGLQSDSRAERYQDQAQEYIGEGPMWDPDQDGVVQEIYGGHPAALAAYMTLLATPIYVTPTTLSESLDWAEGRRWFEEVRCASCHVPALRVKPQNIELLARGKYRATVKINPFTDGQEPRVRRLDYSSDLTGSIPVGNQIFLFSDLKRHRMGEALADHSPERLPDGRNVPADEWLTRPLWGLADSAPYMHDGRAQNVEEAILLHGGEAKSAVQLYQALSDRERGQLRMFLMSLSRDATLLVE